MTLSAVSTVCAALLAVAAALRAQPPPMPSDGPLVAMPNAFSADAATPLGAADGAEVWLKPNGFSTSSPSPLPPSSLLDLSAAKLFAACASAPYPDVDAFSLGLDIIPSTDGSVTTLPGHWNFVELSVRRGSLGKTGTPINTEVGTLGGNEADMFGYVFRGASCIPPEFIDQTYKLADSLDFGMPTPGDVDGLDLYAPLFNTATSATSTVGLPICPICPSLYFSVEGSTANLALVPSAWCKLNGTPVPKSGALIFKSDWNGSSWTCPTVYLTPGMLGLANCEDVDALALEAYGSPVKAVFSTKTAGSSCNSTRDQLLFVVPGTDHAVPVALHYTSGELVSDLIGIRADPVDDVDALCFGDPLCAGRRQQNQVQLERLLSYCSATSTTFGFPRQLGLQGYRAPLTSPSQGFKYLFHAVGGTAGGPAVWALTLPNQYPARFLLTVPFVVQSSGIPGNPVTLPALFPFTMRGTEIVVQVAAAPPVPPLSLRLSHAICLTMW